MNITETFIADLYVLEPTIFKDSRGYFFESFNTRTLGKYNLNFNAVQDNESFSTYGTIRGIHLQMGDSAQAKLVRVITGEVLDVAVDLRPNSSTFGQHYSIKLSGENKRQLLIPKGFGHGFSVLSETAIFSYKCDNYYNKASEAGIIYNDKELNIDWLVPPNRRVISDKDSKLPRFSSI